MASRLLTINAGSSSLRSAVYDLDAVTRPLVAAQISRIGLKPSRMRISDSDGATLLDKEVPLSEHASAFREWFGWLREQGLDEGIAAAGHRVVHGGLDFVQPQLVTDELLTSLEELAALDPEHTRQAVAGIRLAAESLPKALQVACFDTAFHRDMPLVAQRYALPRRYTDAGVIRFGFHGLSYEYVMQELAAMDPGAARGRVIIAHLGNGASMAAVRDGVCIDTTMGFTPAGGLVMSSRSGDLDPGVLIHLLRRDGLGAEALNRLVNSESGLLGVSGMSGDMADLLEVEASDPRAAEAVALFCYQAKKFLAGLAAALGGVDALVFTAGIGENAPAVRQRICDGLGFLGVELEPALNEENAPVISATGGRVTVRVMKTDEDLMIARHVKRLISQGGIHASV
ncbi:MAG: acetate/propionate family kinase [Dehalococcoidia bacterium]|nr:acetate/propionate family kinase [Dehalococcoidia bacterium]